MLDLAGIWIPLVTPFTADDHVDHAALARLVDALAGSGIAGFVALGSTGEAVALDEAEQRAVLDTVLAHAAGRPVLAGVAGVRPQTVAARLARLAGAPLAGVLVHAPAYARPGQDGLLAYFRAVAGASPWPVVLYDIPARTGVRIATDTMLALAAHPNIRGVKDCSGDVEHAQAVIDDGRLQVLAGDDARMFTAMCQGAAGAVAASAHLVPARFAAMHRRLAAGDLAGGRAAWRALRPLVQALFEVPNPAGVKAALAATMDLPGALRAPMTEAPADVRERVLSALRALETAG